MHIECSQLSQATSSFSYRYHEIAPVPGLGLEAR
jgi:hypothetical protein